jgi:hypothetical protein
VHCHAKFLAADLQVQTSGFTVYELCSPWTHGHDQLISQPMPRQLEPPCLLLCCLPAGSWPSALQALWWAWQHTVRGKPGMLPRSPWHSVTKHCMSCMHC